LDRDRHGEYIIIILKILLYLFFQEAKMKYINKTT